MHNWQGVGEEGSPVTQAVPEVVQPTFSVGLTQMGVDALFRSDVCTYTSICIVFEHLPSLG